MVKYFGKVYENKCFISWCHNMINVFTSQGMMYLKEGGTIDLFNLYPICSNVINLWERYTIVSKIWTSKYGWYIMNLKQIKKTVEMEDEINVLNVFNYFFFFCFLFFLYLSRSDLVN